RDVAWYPAVLPVSARRDRVDVLHCTTMRAPWRSRVPLVITIHDLAVLRHPEAFNRWTRTYSARALPRVARAASAIVVVSEFTGGEVRELLGVPAEKVRVIPHGVGPPFEPDGPKSDGSYVLAVSTLEPRKNLPRLVEGFRRAELNGYELRVVGAEGWGGAGRRRCGRTRGRRRHGLTPTSAVRSPRDTADRHRCRRPRAGAHRRRDVCPGLAARARRRA